MQEIRLGKRNNLAVMRKVDFGVYLDAGEIGEVLLPQRYVPENCEEGDVLNVFLYLDSEERLVATTEYPLVEVGEFAYLEVKWTNEYGAFLDWGLMKDLFCPFREQKMRMVNGNKYIVYAYIDPITYRITASAKVDKFLTSAMPPYKHGDCVDILIQQKTDLGFKAIVENKYSGLIYSNEIFQNLHTGDRPRAYVKQVREDGKIDLALQTTGRVHVNDFSEVLLEHLIASPNGFLPFHDKSPAEDIYEEFGVSKKTFKRASGTLYSKHYITISDDGLTLTNEGRLAGCIDD